MTEQNGTAQKIRSAGILVCMLMAAIAIGIGTAQARPKKGDAQPMGLPEKISTLGTKLYGQEIDDAKPITDEIQKLVVAHLNTWIANRSPNIIQVRQELDRLFAKLQYPAAGISSAFRAPWKGMQLIGAGYTLEWSNIWRVNVLVIYENQNGHTREVTISHFVPRTDLHFATLAPSSAGDFRFLAYGYRLGMSHPRLTAILYSFDGKTLQPQWKSEDLFDGKLSINNNLLVISYVNEDEYIRQTQQGRLPSRHEKTYKVTPQGIQFESEHDIPYQ